MKKKVSNLIFVIMFLGCIFIFFKDKIITQAPDNTTVTDNDRTRPHRVEKETLSQDGLGQTEYRGIISLSQLKSENELLKAYVFHIKENEYSYRISNSYISRRLEDAFLVKRTPDIKKAEEDRRFQKHIADDGTFIDTLYYLYFDAEVMNTGVNVYHFPSSFLMFTTIYDNICEMKSPRFDIDGDIRFLSWHPNYIIETSEEKLVTGIGNSVPAFKPGEEINLKFCFIVTEDIIDDIYIYTSGGKNAKDTIEDNTVNYIKINPKKIEE